MQQKDTEYISRKIEIEKKINEMVNLLHKKQEHIDELIKEKKYDH